LSKYLTAEKLAGGGLGYLDLVAKSLCLRKQNCLPAVVNCPPLTIKNMNLLFKALNDQTRREILTLLKEGDKTAGEIADRFNISKPSISHHLDLLKQAGLVEAEKQGQFISYSLNTTVVDEIAQWFIQFKTKKK
jgi:DNA-binding transcriptional ArsR family regulator